MDDHLCHCGHEQILHSSTDNTCFILGCPCDEGFQHKWMEISPRLKAALERRDKTTRATLKELNAPAAVPQESK